MFYGEKALRGSHILGRLDLEAGAYVPSTVHRAENTGDPARVRVILEGLAAVAREVPVIPPPLPSSELAPAILAALGTRGAEAILDVRKLSHQERKAMGRRGLEWITANRDYAVLSKRFLAGVLDAPVLAGREAR
ncbi:MAG: hypothetical protein ACREU8_01420 [Gammaproteobacteria bacterium]